MTDPKTLSSVAEFHKTFQHPILDTPTIPSEQRCALRVSLIAEELKELEEAIQDKDLVEIADALCDIQYVLAGAVLEFGLKDKFSALFDEVQRSNMSKACKDEAEA
ncbi:nucleoside triphosphate pyrophosphohydrolase family protein, partial [Sphingobacterium sp. UBA7253]